MTGSFSCCPWCKWCDLAVVPRTLISDKVRLVNAESLFKNLKDVFLRDFLLQCGCPSSKTGHNVTSLLLKEDFGVQESGFLCSAMEDLCAGSSREVLGEVCDRSCHDQTFHKVFK